jgi:hypothetical protein
MSLRRPADLREAGGAAGDPDRRGRGGEAKRRLLERAGDDRRRGGGSGARDRRARCADPKRWRGSRRAACWSTPSIARPLRLHASGDRRSRSGARRDRHRRGFGRAGGGAAPAAGSIAAGELGGLARDWRRPRAIRDRWPDPAARRARSGARRRARSIPSARMTADGVATWLAGRGYRSRLALLRFTLASPIPTI